MRRFFHAATVTVLTLGSIIILTMFTRPSPPWGQAFLHEQQPLGVVGVGNSAGGLIRGDTVLTSGRDWKVGDIVTVKFRTGMEREGRVTAHDKDYHLALVRIEPVLFPILRPAKKAVVKNQTVNVCGFEKGDYKEVRGRATNVGESFMVNQRVHRDMVGGPVLNDGGEVVGIFAGGRVFAYCNGLETIKSFIEHHQ